MKFFRPVLRSEPFKTDIEHFRSVLFVFMSTSDRDCWRDQRLCERSITFIATIFVRRKYNKPSTTILNQVISYCLVT